MISILLTAIILAHDWYPAECCSGQDCHPVPCTEIIDGEWQGHKFNKHSPSPDGKCHICVYQQKDYPKPRYLCIFTPEGIS